MCFFNWKKYIEQQNTWSYLLFEVEAIKLKLHPLHQIAWKNLNDKIDFFFFVNASRVFLF